MIMKRLTKKEIDFLNFIEFRLVPDMRESAKYEVKRNEAEYGNYLDIEEITEVECSTADDLEKLVKIARKLSGVKPDSEGWV